MAENRAASVILFFIDGLGIGEESAANPLAQIPGLGPLAHFKGRVAPIGGDGQLVATDARLGVEGRPQSATGQTTILTGVNVPGRLGYHKQGFPNAAMREILAEHSIFRRLQGREIGPNVFVNAYTPQFFAETPRWKSATTVAVEAAGLPLRRLPDLLGRHALFHDFTNRDLIRRGFEAPTFSPEEAASILAGFADRYRFVLYEHFITDKIGHDQDWERARTHLPEMAAMIRRCLELIDFETTTLILTSDHGNIEDLSVRNHTLNDVPTIVWGRMSREVAGRINDLSDITPAILHLLTR